MLGAIPGGLLQRQLRFRDYYSVQTASVLIYVVIEIAAALAGAGALCVVYGQIVMAVMNWLGWSAIARYRPRLAWSTSFLRKELRFTGSWFSLQGMRGLSQSQAA